MNMIKFKDRDVNRMLKHYLHEEAQENELRINNFSIINSTLTHMNYNLFKKDMKETYDELKKKTCARHNDTTTFCSCILTLPQDYKGDPKDFFQAGYDIFKEIPEMKYCIGAFVHMDESTPHMHYVFMPIEEKEKIVKKRQKVFDEKKGREVSRNVEYKYQYNFNCRKLIDKKFLDEFHPKIQEEMKKKDITATIITEARIEFNRLKKEKFEETKKAIELEPEKKNELIDEYYKFWQNMNPKDYKRHMKDKPKNHRIKMFEEMVKEHEQLLMQEAQQKIDEFINDTNLKVATEKEAIKKDAKEQIESERKKTIEEIEIKKAELEAEKQKGMQALNDLEQEVKSIFDKYENDEKELQKYMQKDEKLQRIIDKRKRNAPTKEDYEAVLELFENAYNAYAKQYNENVQLSISYNELVRDYNDLNKNHQQEINSIRNHYEKMIDDLKKKYENFKNYIYGLLEKLGIHRPFNNNEKDEMIALKEQVDRSAVYYRKGVEQLEVPRTIQKTVNRSMNIDRTER